MLTCNKGVGFIALYVKRAKKISWWLEKVPNKCWATVPLYAKMTSKKHFRNAIYANGDAKLSPAAGSKACFNHKIFLVAKIFINFAPGECSCLDGTFYVEYVKHSSFHDFNSWCETDAIGIA